MSSAGKVSGKAASSRRWQKRLGWFALIWMAGVGALGLVALAVRGLMNAAGLTA